MDELKLVLSYMTRDEAWKETYVNEENTFSKRFKYFLKMQVLMCAGSICVWIMMKSSNI